MRKRILGAAVLFSFIVSLTAASNMKEDVKIKKFRQWRDLQQDQYVLHIHLRQNQMKKQESKKKKV